MINSTKLGRWASKCASPSTSNKNRILFLLISLLTFSAATALAEGKWVETNITDIEDGDVVVITVTTEDKTFAMSNDANATQTYTPEAIEVAVEGQILKEQPPTNLKWKFSDFKEMTSSYITDAYNKTNFRIIPLDGQGKLSCSTKSGTSYKVEVKISGSSGGSLGGGSLGGLGGGGTSDERFYISNTGRRLKYDGNGNASIWLTSNTSTYSWTAVNGSKTGQEQKFYKYVEDLDNTPIYTRDVQPNNFGTICLPKGSSTFTGASFYEIAGKEVENGNVKGITLASVDKLEAGMPYIFQVDNNATLITVTYDEGKACETASNKNGLYGTFKYTAVGKGFYIIEDGKWLAQSDGTCWVDANRAYVNMEDVPDTYTKMPGRRYIGMGVQGENEATGLDNTTAPEEQIIKVIENGQLIIIRNGEKYNVQGQKL